mmetsp:Transcript_699/g.1331  ORF Transcript_699/g.1331 Transcript_699/m.1331 type:complete len:255 (+) Transcript_699:719-1483(+)
MNAEHGGLVFMAAKLGLTAVALVTCLQRTKPQAEQVMEDQIAFEDPCLAPEEREHLLELLGLLDEPNVDWEEVRRTDNAILLKKDLGSSPVAVIKAHFRLDGLTTECVFKTIWDDEYRREWDNVLKEFTVLEQYTSQSDLAYFYVESPTFLVANRDFLQRRVFTKQPDGTWVIVYWSIERPDVPTKSGWVRAHTSISGYRIREIEGGCVLDYLSHNDVKGLIPPFLINAFAPSKALEWSERMQVAAAKLLERLT